MSGKILESDLHNFYMPLPHKLSSGLLMGGVFFLMVTLMVVIEITGLEIAKRMLIILVPFGGVVLGTVSAVEAESKIEIVPAIVLVLSAGFATTLAVSGANPFANRIVDIALISSIAVIRYTHLIQPIVKTTRQYIKY